MNNSLYCLSNLVTTNCDVPNTYFFLKEKRRKVVFSYFLNLFETAEKDATYTDWYIKSIRLWYDDEIQINWVNCYKTFATFTNEKINEKKIKYHWKRNPHSTFYYINNIFMRIYNKLAGPRNLIASPAARSVIIFHRFLNIIRWWSAPIGLSIMIYNL